MIKFSKQQDTEVKETEPKDIYLEPRTQISHQFHGYITEISYEGKKWKVLDSNVNFVNNANTLWVSLGGNRSREKLLVDSHSPVMLNVKKQVLARAKGKAIEEVLNILNEIINELTDIPGKARSDVEDNLEERIDFYIDEKQKTRGQSPIIKLDEFIEDKILVCRHKAIIASILGAYCVEQQILPKGKVRTYRATLADRGFKFGAHAWAIYSEEATGEIRIFDPMWQKVLNISKLFNSIKDLSQSQQDETLRETGYFSTTLRDMVKRLDHKDKIELRNQNRVLDIVKNFNKRHNLFPNMQVATFTLGTAITRGEQIRIELKSYSKDNHRALYHAIKRQGIYAQMKNHGNDFIYIPIQGNAKLLSLNFNNLFYDYTKLLQVSVQPKACLDAMFQNYIAEQPPIKKAKLKTELQIIISPKFKEKKRARTSGAPLRMNHT